MSTQFLSFDEEQRLGQLSPVAHHPDAPHTPSPRCRTTLPSIQYLEG